MLNAPARSAIREKEVDFIPTMTRRQRRKTITIVKALAQLCLAVASAESGLAFSFLICTFWPSVTESEGFRIT